MFSRILLISLCFKNTVTVHSVDKNMEKHIEIMKSKNNYDYPFYNDLKAPSSADPAIGGAAAETSKHC